LACQYGIKRQGTGLVPGVGVDDVAVNPAG